MKVAIIIATACWISVVICYLSLSLQLPMGTEFHVQDPGMPVYIHSLMHSFHLQVFLKHPLCAKY